MVPYCILRKVSNHQPRLFPGPSQLSIACSRHAHRESLEMRLLNHNYMLIYLCHIFESSEEKFSLLLLCLFFSVIMTLLTPHHDTGNPNNNSITKSHVRIKILSCQLLMGDFLHCRHSRRQPVSTVLTTAFHSELV